MAHPIMTHLSRRARMTHSWIGSTVDRLVSTNKGLTARLDRKQFRLLGRRPAHDVAVGPMSHALNLDVVSL